MSAFYKKSMWTSLVAAMALICAMAMSSEQAFANRGGGPFGGRMENLQKLLDLSEQQVDQLQALRIENREAMRKARQEMMNARRQFRSTIKDSGNDMAVREAFHPVADAMENMEVLKVKMFREYKTILSDDQFEKFQALRKIMSRKQGRHGKFRAFQAGGPQGTRDDMPWDKKMENTEIE